jgi:uncharacterized protein YbbC (DUF1343 family)
MPVKLFLWFACFILLIGSSLTAQPVKKGKVFLGIDSLKADHFKILAGKRVALVTNHTGRDRNGISDIDLLFEAKSFRLIKLFCPEHGIRGTEDGTIANEVDAKTGLPIISLYGKHKIPTAENLVDVDVLVFDIQDIGTRFYTYIGTLAYVMRAAKANHKEVVVLDRPNPIGGLKVEGTIPPDSLTDQLTAIYPIPTQHGMTIGELAHLFNLEYGIGCELTVIPMRGWKRAMFWDDTGIVWINPSPNMKTLVGAILYPGLGCLETTNLSMGRGTDTPFEIYGAPWLDGPKLAQKMNGYELPGIRFVPWQFTPGRSNFKYFNELCHGVKVVVFDRENFDGYLTGLHLAKTIWEMHPEKYKFLAGFKILMGCAETEHWIQSGVPPEEIKTRKTPALKNFLALREKYLLYD